ncbi:hypothetical protein BGZ70_009126 [Mortierella alpina]|uniref:Leucine rich repeat domain-containing protein n=1 Tax=Mortierella alpina TaxID=64518 RepID=A0A9P6M0U7_MORAP|nr:hypothetical protein BGZ70_009126 [Mortierella alpina]
MDKPINGDKYIRTLSHYLRHNQRRLVPTAVDNGSSNSNSSSGSSSGSVGHGARSFVTPSDPMAAAYSGMVNSLWSMGTAVVNTMAPSAESPPTTAQDRDSFSGAWDGTGSIPADANPRERQLYLQAQLKAPIFPLDLYYLLYLLDRFELAGIEIEGWDGSTPRSVGDTNPRVLKAASPGGSGTGAGPNSSTYSSFRPPASSTRPQSIRSFSSTALSTLTLITGWKQWSNAASANNGATIEDDVHFIHKFLKNIAGLRLVAKIPPGLDVPGKGRIEGYSADAILNIYDAGRSSPNFAASSSKQQLLLPLASTFSSLTHLELHKIPPRSIEGWETLMIQLKSLVIIQAGMEDIHDVIVTAVVESERRRRRRVSKEKNRAVLIRQEQREALKDAALISKGRRLGQGSGSSSVSTSSSSASSSPDSSNPSSPSTSPILSPDSYSEDEEAILRSIKMWPALRHLSVSDNALPTLQHSDTFSHTLAIVSLDLSHNLLIAPPPGLIHLHNLQSLNMSYNMMESVQAIYQILGNIAVLDLRGNRLTSLCGLERLWNLEKVDVRDNRLDEAAEVGRLAALPGIREVWAESNPFCEKQPKYRLEILAVFKANGHDLLLDGTFASFVEKRSLANMSPTAFSTTLSSINNVNLANIPAASAPTATLAKGLASPPPRVTRPSGAGISSESHEEHRPSLKGSSSSNSNSQSATKKEGYLNATSPPGSNPASPVKLVKKKLVKSSKRVKRVVNLDSDHDDEEEVDSRQPHDAENSTKILGPPAEIAKKKKKTKKPAAAAAAGDDTIAHEGEEKNAKKKVIKKKKSQGPVSFAGDDHGHAAHPDGHGLAVNHAEGKDNHHVHRLSHLEQSMATMQVHQRNSSDNDSSGDRPSSPSQQHHHRHQRQPSRGILKKSTSGGFDQSNITGPSSPRMRPASYDDSSSDEGGAEGYRRKIEAMRNEAGSNWLKVLAEMDSETQIRKNSEAGQFR